MSNTKGKTIKCKAAVFWEINKPLTVETVEVAPPKAKEVRVQVAYTGICHSDAHFVNGCIAAKTPAILGHEGAGIVESVGDGVTKYKPGEKVMLCFLPECNECSCCKSGRTATCELFMDKNYAYGFLLDGTTRFTCRGKPTFHVFQTSTFSQYTVVSEISLIKINQKAPMDKVCLLSCGVGTGYGTAVNTAKVKKGSTCAVWGLGCIGLAVVMGCRAAGAGRIIGIDINPAKFEFAKKFGITEAINPLDYEKPFQDVLVEKTNGGVDYAFECVGTTKTMEQAFYSLHKGWGLLSIVGIAPQGENLQVSPFEFLYGKTITGALYGDFRRAKQIPEMVEKYMKKEIMLDEFITHSIDLDHINDGFQLMKDGKSCRSVVKMM